MAIYSFNHNSFGKTTNHAGAAGDNARYNSDLSKTQTAEFLAANAMHLKEHGEQRSEEEMNAHLDQFRQGRSAAENAAYNARREATYAVRSHVIPREPEKAQAWFDAQEKTDRKNARMSDRFIGALPRELTPDQCIEAVESFCQGVTQDRVPWHFALHLELDQRGQPDWNPHAHIIIRDRDIETGKRYLYTSSGPMERAQLAQKGQKFWTTKDFRVEWEQQMNRALERAGHDVRVDHRTLKEQGIGREPQIHIGPGSQNAAKKGHQFKSQDRQQGERAVVYTLLDNGSRAGHNAQIVERNAARATTGHSPSDPRTARALQERLAEQPPRTPHQAEQHQLRETQNATRRAMLKDQKRDREVLRVVHSAEWEKHRAEGKGLYAHARSAVFEQVKAQTAGEWQKVQAIKDRDQREMADAVLRLQIKALHDKISAQRIAEARKQKDAAWKELKERQAKERLELRGAHREENTAMTKQHAAERFGLREQQRPFAANRVAARIGGYQGMASQQNAAHRAIQLNQRPNGVTPHEFASPAEAARAYQEIARQQHSRCTGIRERLNAQRQTNQLRAMPADRARARANRGIASHDIPPSQQEQARQAVQSGRTLTVDERSKVSPDLKAQLVRQDRRMAQRSSFTREEDNRQPRGRGGRSGGGRGR